MTVCALPECGRPMNSPSGHGARGLCKVHYERMMRTPGSRLWDHAREPFAPKLPENEAGASIVGVGELPHCGQCDTNDWILSWDGAGRYVCLRAGCAARPFAPAPEVAP